MAAGGPREKLRVVLDASVVARWVIPGEPWERESVLLKDMVARGHLEAHAPALLLYEVSSVLSRAVRGGIISEASAKEALGLLEHLIIAHPVEWGDAPEILELSLKTGLTVYDSAYVHLSARLGAVLVTADEELASRGEGVARTILVADVERLLSGLRP